MSFKRVVWSCLFFLTLVLNTSLFAAISEKNESEPKTVKEPKVGSWTFSGMVSNESGERYGYFFQMLKQGSNIHAKTALIDAQTNQLILFYEGDEKVDVDSPLNWHVGRSFIRHNPINDSWVFGVKSEKEKGFNFKVDMLKQGNIPSDIETLTLRPGVELQALQTSRLNGHVQTGAGTKEQFVTGNNAWFGKLWFTTDPKKAHDVHTTFCRLNNDSGFYSANLKEADATGAAVAGWRDALGKKVKMSQFLSIRSIAEDQSLLSLGLPKLRLKVLNTLKKVDSSPLSIAGFLENDPKGFCFVTNQSFSKTQEVVG